MRPNIEDKCTILNKKYLIFLIIFHFRPDFFFLNQFVSFAK